MLEFCPWGNFYPTNKEGALETLPAQIISAVPLNWTGSLLAPVLVGVIIKLTTFEVTVVVIAPAVMLFPLAFTLAVVVETN